MAFKDNSEEIKQRLRQAISRGLDTAGVIVQGEAQALSPVDSGYLRDSIDTRQEEEQTDVFVQSVGTPAEHAVFNEFGKNILCRIKIAESSGKAKGLIPMLIRTEG